MSPPYKFYLALFFCYFFPKNNVEIWCIHVLTFVQKDKIKTACVSNARKLRENIETWSITLIKCTFYFKYTKLSIYLYGKQPHEVQFTNRISKPKCQNANKLAIWKCSEVRVHTLGIFGGYDCNSYFGFCYCFFFLSHRCLI